MLPQRIGNWLLTNLQQRLVKHARYYWRLLTKSHLTRRLFENMLTRIVRCPCQPGRRAEDQIGFQRRDRVREGKASQTRIEKGATAAF